MSFDVSPSVPRKRCLISGVGTRTRATAIRARITGSSLESLPIQRSQVLDLFDMRMALGTFVVRRLATTITPEQTQRLRINLDAQSRALKEQDNQTSTRLDTEFHLLLCEFAGNQEIREVMERLRGKLHR